MAMQLRFLLFALAVTATLLAAGCGADTTESQATTTVEVEGRFVLRGEVVVRGDDSTRPLPEGARVVVHLADISVQDTTSVLIAEATTTHLTLPLTYELRWDTDLETGRDYGVSAEVVDAEGELLYVSDTVHPFRPGDAEVIVELVDV